MVGKQLPISTSLINPFGTSIIDQVNRFLSLFSQQSDGILIMLFSTRFQRVRGCSYGIPKPSQNKMKSFNFRLQPCPFC